MSSSGQIQIFPHQQEESKVIGQNTENGNYIVKIHVLSNTEALNGNRYGYRDVSELPESFLNELVRLPVIGDHNWKEFDALRDQLESEGKTECQIRDALVKKSSEMALGYIDDIYKPGKITYNNMIPETELFAAMEVVDPKENEYIAKHGKTSKEFTSIATLGEYKILPNGKTVYDDMTKARPFHIAMANDPAFGKQLAKVRGVCRGEKASCKMKLMYQSLDNRIISDDESINTKENDNTLMSKQQESAKEIPNAPTTNDNKNTTTPVKEVEQSINKVDHKPGQQEEKEKADQDQILKKPAPEVQEENKEEEEQPAPNNKKDDDTEARIAKLQQELEDQKRTFRRSLLKYNVDPKAFKSEDEMKAEQDRVMSVIEGYNLKNEDAEWLVSKAFARTIQAAEKNVKPIYNSMLYNASDAAKSTVADNNSAPSNKKSEYNLLENEY